MSKKVGFYWFTNDLRLHDQPALSHAAASVDELICFSHLPKAWDQSSSQMRADLGDKREQFLLECLASLNCSLKTMGQRLWVTDSDAFAAMVSIIKDQSVTDVFCSEHVGWYEKQLWISLEQHFPEVRFHLKATHTLFDDENLPFTVDEMPAGFNGVRKKLEKSVVHLPIESVTALPPLPANMTLAEAFHELDLSKVFIDKESSEQAYIGGEQAGLKHLESYLSSTNASTYKQTRNALDGWSSSCKFSPWLALGCLSVRRVIADLKAYEKEQGANDSTYWIYVELLWREYFQWYAHRHTTKLYAHGGQADKELEYKHNDAVIKQWVGGQTPYPLVNACMVELKLTGFLSNRGRQIVASCFVNELAQDWRYGAAYFEQVLMDFDVAVNWGNWQYIAGAGPANVQKKHFNLEKQAQTFDRQGVYTQNWLSR